MDKGKIKSFAIWARRELIARVSDRANCIGIYDNRIEKVHPVQGGFKVEGRDDIFTLPISYRNALIHQINEKGFEQVMEEAAYTWFNRFMGIRYMEVNDYLPSGIRVLSSEVEGKMEPDVLGKISEVLEELEFENKDREIIYSLLDSGKPEDREKAYKKIVIKQCNELGKIIPQMFEKISDYTELLFPDNLLQDGSVIRRMVSDIDEDDWREEVEIVGWMYQYYISEKKDEVFAALKKNIKISKENIPAATQLFTPKWIVKYMVENSLGRLWIEGHPNEELKSQWKYYLGEAEQEPEVEEELKKIREEHSRLSPEDIKVLDPCMGSGHILVYAFDVLYEIYKSAGYSEREIPRLILKNNLYGLDIDDRAAQLASFALIMKARHYNRRLFREIQRENLELNLCSIQESNDFPKDAIDYLVSSKNIELAKSVSRDEVEYLINVFKNSKEYGSILEVKKIDFEAIERRLIEVENTDTVDFFDMQYRNVILDIIPKLLKQARIMSRKYDVCVTNPPYMGSKGTSSKLKKYLENNFIDSKYDLFSVFMEKLNAILSNNGMYSMINQHSWMFLASYKNLRAKIMKQNIIVNMIHLGTKAFEDIGGEVVQSTAFINRKSTNKRYNGKFIRVTNVNNAEEKELRFLRCCSGLLDNNMFIVGNKDFELIDGCPICYWGGKRIGELFKNTPTIGSVSVPKRTLQTGDSVRFIRKWYEISSEKICFNYLDRNKILKLNYKWYMFSYGGEYRKWYGNIDNIVNWFKNGEEIKSTGKAIIPSEKKYFNSNIGWSKITSGNISLRYYNKGIIPGDATACIFDLGDKNNYVMAYLNSKVSKTFLEILSPTLNFSTGTIAKLPFIINSKYKIAIDRITNSNIDISKREWNSFETSWDFKVHPLLKLLDRGEQYKLQSVFLVRKNECEEAFEQLKSNEEELNRIFIDIYGLQDELTPEVEDKDITIRKADRVRDIKSLISYYIGCLLGRYSVDVEGLIYAGGLFSDKWQNIDDKWQVRNIKKDEERNIISDTWSDTTFVPDVNNIIPITEDEYFEDDIVARFIEFIRTIYGDENLEENLDFIADSIGRKTSETSRQAIRRYFVKDFYKDHLKIYQKRPIYWMFDSGKNEGFKCLIYMHRYDEQTIAKIRTDYLHPLQRKYEARINTLQMVIDSTDSSNKDKTVAKKKIEKIKKQLEECIEYDQVVAHMANEKIKMDLDDGVKVNYSKFQDVRVIDSKGREVSMNLLAKI